MCSLIDLCFLCTKDINYCVSVNNEIVSQVEYLLPEITIIKLGIPLRICSACDGALCTFSKFKHSSVESSRRLEARIKGAQGPPLHTGSPPHVDDRETSGAKPEKMEEIFIKEEYMEETPLDTQMHTNRAFLDPIAFSETISSEPQTQLHKDRNIQLHTDKNFVNKKEITIKEEQIEEIPEDREFYNNVLKKECVSNSMNDDTYRQPEHNTEDESATFNKNEEVWEGSSADSEEETVEETDETCTNNIESDTNEITRKTKNQNQLKTKIQIKKEHGCNVCAVCKKIFVHNYDLHKHMDLHNGIKNFPCSICNIRFVNNHNLNQHIKLHTERKENRSHSRMKDSSLCSVFKYRNNVNRYMKIISGVKKFQCKICETSFTRKSNLTTHIKIHFGVTFSVKYVKNRLR